MSNKVISEKLKNFINKYLNSWNEVQVLAHFYNNPNGEYSSDIIADMLTSDEQLISKSLEDLAVQNLLSVRKSEEKSSYVYNYNDEGTDSIIKLLSLTHKANLKPIMKIINKKLEASEGEKKTLNNFENPKNFSTKFIYEKTKKYPGTDNKRTGNISRRSV